MFKPILLGGLTATAIAVHCVETKKAKDNLRKFCPVFDKFNEKFGKKNKDSNRKDRDLGLD